MFRSVQLSSIDGNDAPALSVGDVICRADRDISASRVETVGDSSKLSKS